MGKISNVFRMVMASLGFLFFLIILLVFISPGLVSRSFKYIGSIPNFFPHKTEDIDFSKTKNYSDLSVGVSFDYPDSLLIGGTEFNFGVFYSRKDSISFYKKNLSQPIFSVSRKNEKFDPNNVEEFFWGNFTRLSFVRKAYAMPPPTTKKINNLKVVNIAGNNYYTYSYVLDRNKYNKYILDEEDGYITFSFINQKESFINNVLFSVKNLNNQRDEMKKQFLSIVEKHLRSIGKFDCVGMSIHDQFSPDCKSYINLDKTVVNIEDKNTVTVNIVIDFDGKARYWNWGLNKLDDWTPVYSNQQYDYKLIKKNGVFNLVEGLGVKK